MRDITPMNRRQLFQSIAGIAAAKGLTVKSYDAPQTAPALVVFESTDAVDPQVCMRLIEYFENTLKGTPFEGVKAIILTDGMKMTVLDANGTLLNERVEC